MSSYCGAPIVDTRHGYAHHPLTRMEALCALHKRALYVKEIDHLIDRLRELAMIYSVKRDAAKSLGEEK